MVPDLDAPPHQPSMKTSTKPSEKTLGSYLRPYWRPLAIGGVFLVLTNVVDKSIPWLLQHAIDGIVGTRTYAALDRALRDGYDRAFLACTPDERMVARECALIDAARALAEAKLAGIQLLQSLQTALAADGHLLSSTERADIDLYVADLQAAIERSSEPGTIEAATVALVQATDDFAGRRMNQSIISALEGKTLDAL